jgi:DNA-directed RNA polymerase subunit M/transcription elongation factor TFIIS
MTTSEETLACPECSKQLLIGNTTGLRRYVCDGCGSSVMGIPVLRQLGDPHAAQLLWATSCEAAAEAAGNARAGNGAICPFCHQFMLPAVTAQGKGGICKECEMIWLDKTAFESFPANPDAKTLGSTASLSRPERCEECGAPIASSDEDRCPYCGTTFKAPTKYVILPTATSGGPSNFWESRSDEGMAGMLFRGIVRGMRP